MNQTRPSLRIISLGLGQQSTALYFMSSLGELPRADYAIFSDTGSEKKTTYKYLKWLQDWQKRYSGIPIKIAKTKRSLYSDLIKGTNESGSRFSSIPAYVQSKKGKIGMLKRQCTSEYKVVPMFKVIREIYGLRKYQRTPKTEIWFGITIEEFERLRFPDHNWQTNVYPFCNYKTFQNKSIPLNLQSLTRSNCVKWLSDKNLPVPEKSACFFCPYQSNSHWLDTKRNRPIEWNRAIALDERIRDSSNKGVKQPIFLHRNGLPLSEVDLNENQLDIFNGECEGMCGV